MPVRGKNLTAMLLESIDDRPAPTAVAKDASDNFAAELGAAIATGETDFGTLPPLRPAFKEASASSKDTPASASNRRMARAGSAKTSEKTSAQSMLAQAPLAPAFVPVAPNNSTPDLSPTDADPSVAKAAAQADPQMAAATSIVIPDARPSAGAPIMTIAPDRDASGKSAPDSPATSQAADSAQSAQSGESPSNTTASTSPNSAREQQPVRDQQSGHSPADSPSGVSLKIRSSSQSNSSQQTTTAQPNDGPVRQAGQASGQAVTQPINPVLQKNQPGQPEPDAAAGTNLASVGAHSGPAQSQAGDTRAVTATPVASVTPIAHAPETATQRVANLKVDLNEAGSAHATIRERAGEVNVKIVTPNSDSARNLVNEVNALRRSFDGAGLKLRNAEVVYRSDRDQNPQRDDSRQSNQQSDAGSAETFTIEETNQ